ncbi:translation initiation factor IF-2 N-terminal domain-containing protein [Glutamicibacter nicotianae]|uniref:translation initiation factor IF-2 N-terminal domain-containing protein n=1 Tax=Glutamicibacter nicotianae TaxID=37929 RepID=UPI00255498F7|nr:translation initiation factor IF-2 N-terminal domain-containing protein [Glutamicibacter nicotianae]WIV43502.1 translation initiation factor IF-2 N-terminal domain-containing protein [Glutamicibacter nicotianae]
MSVVRVHEVAKELGITSKAALMKLQEQGIFVRSASSTIDSLTARRLKDAFGALDNEALGSVVTPRQLGWNAGAVRPVTHQDAVFNIQKLCRAFPVAKDQQEALARLGSQFFFASPCKIKGFEECYTAFVRFSQAIETAFGLTREVLFFFSPHADLQMRTFNAARQVIRESSRDLTPDMMFFWSPDPRLREKLDDWSTGQFLAIPLILSDEDDPIAFISLIRDYVFSRDLFYETTPVYGERFFGRRKLLQELRDDVKNHRVTGLFGLRKAGKTSVLTELAQNLTADGAAVILRDLESLPSPPDDPVPDLLRDLVEDLLVVLRKHKLPTQHLSSLSVDFGIAEFKRAAQKVLRKLELSQIEVILMLDEIEYLTPSERIDVREGDMASVAQLLGALRSLVQENSNFTFIMSGLTSSIIESGRLYGRPNPLFSWAKAHFLAPFDRNEADELARSVGQKMGISVESGALGALFEATGGHAFLYRQLASTVVTELPKDSFHRKISRSDVLRAFEAWRLVMAGHMHEMVEHVKRYYPEEAFLLEVLREEPALFESMSRDEPLALGHLLNLGLVVREGREFELTPVLNVQ